MLLARYVLLLPACTFLCDFCRNVRMLVYKIHVPGSRSLDQRHEGGSGYKAAFMLHTWIFHSMPDFTVPHKIVLHRYNMHCRASCPDMTSPP